MDQPSAGTAPLQDQGATGAGGSLSEQLGSFLYATGYEDLGEAAVQRAKVHVLDWVACAWAGTRTGPGRIFLDDARAHPESGPATAIGLDDLRSTRQAAFLGGALSKASQLDDMDRPSIVHPAVAICPAALAVAEQRQASGRELLRAVVLGYETATRIGRAAGPGHYDNWHSTGTCGIFGAAVAAGLLSGLDASALSRALGIAGAQSAGLIQCVIDDVPEGLFLHSGKAATDGVLAARLAGAGLPGAARVLEGSSGFFAATAPEPEPALVVDGLDAPLRSWAIEGVSLKRWPSCMYTHTAVEAAQAIARRAATTAYDRVVIETTKHGCSIVDKPRPADVREARYSLQFGVAAALLGRPFGHQVFSEETLAAGDMVDLMRRIDVRQSDAMERHFPDRWPSRVRVRTADGQEFDETVLNLPGGPEDPMSFEDAAAKLAEVTEGLLEPGAVRRAVEAVDALDRGGPVEPVLRPQ